MCPITSILQKAKDMSLGHPYNYFEALDSFDFKMTNNGEIIN